MRHEEPSHTDALYSELAAAGSDAIVIGIDEVGRGAVAGSLLVAAVCLPLLPKIYGLDDSKKLSARRREQLAIQIRVVAQAIGLAEITAPEIDRIGMAKAIRNAFASALEATGLRPDLVLIDGNPLQIHPTERSIIKGDAKVATIAAASIIAKVTRDEQMVAAASCYPGYGFERNKGYASAKHIEAIRSRGLSPLHRHSFCSNFLQQSLF